MLPQMRLMCTIWGLFISFDLMEYSMLSRQYGRTMQMDQPVQRPSLSRQQKIQQITTFLSSQPFFNTLSDEARNMILTTDIEQSPALDGLHEATLRLSQPQLDYVRERISLYFKGLCVSNDPVALARALIDFQKINLEPEEAYRKLSMHPDPQSFVAGYGLYRRYFQELRALASDFDPWTCPRLDEFSRAFGILNSVLERYPFRSDLIKNPNLSVFIIQLLNSPVGLAIRPLTQLMQYSDVFIFDKDSVQFWRTIQPAYLTQNVLDALISIASKTDDLTMKRQAVTEYLNSVIKSQEALHAIQRDIYAMQKNEENLRNTLEANDYQERLEIRRIKEKEDEFIKNKPLIQALLTTLSSHNPIIFSTLSTRDNDKLSQIKDLTHVIKLINHLCEKTSLLTGEAGSVRFNQLIERMRTIRPDGHLLSNVNIISNTVLSFLYYLDESLVAKETVERLFNAIMAHPDLLLLNRLFKTIQQYLFSENQAQAAAQIELLLGAAESRAAFITGASSSSTRAPMFMWRSAVESTENSPLDISLKILSAPSLTRRSYGEYIPIVQYNMANMLEAVQKANLMTEDNLTQLLQHAAVLSANEPSVTQFWRTRPEGWITQECLNTLFSLKSFSDFTQYMASQPAIAAPTRGFQ